jgi:hypothetical protein
MPSWSVNANVGMKVQASERVGGTMRDVKNEPNEQVSTASWIAVAFAWLLVGLPLGWGISVTLEQAARLFQ